MHFKINFRSCARHVFRDTIMKKILTLAIVTFLLGGFCFNANAQERKNQAPVKKEVTTAKKVIKTNEGSDKLIKDYELAVDQCVECYQAKQNSTQANKVGNFDKLLAKAEDLKGKIEKTKDSLSKEQIERFNKATKKLSVVYTKG